MMKSLIKLMLPSAETLAKYAAEGIAKSANSALAGKEMTTAKYSDLAIKAADVAAKVAEIMKDGQIDKAEEDELATFLTPLFEKAIALI